MREQLPVTADVLVDAEVPGDVERRAGHHGLGVDVVADQRDRLAELDVERMLRLGGGLAHVARELLLLLGGQCALLLRTAADSERTSAKQNAIR